MEAKSCSHNSVIQAKAIVGESELLLAGSPLSFGGAFPTTSSALSIGGATGGLATAHFNLFALGNIRIAILTTTGVTNSLIAGAAYNARNPLSQTSILQVVPTADIPLSSQGHARATISWTDGGTGVNASAQIEHTTGILTIAPTTGTFAGGSSNCGAGSSAVFMWIVA
jgi:hypothetical protein